MILDIFLSFLLGALCALLFLARGVARKEREVEAQAAALAILTSEAQGAAKEAKEVLALQEALADRLHGEQERVRHIQDLANASLNQATISRLQWGLRGAESPEELLSALTVARNAMPEGYKGTIVVCAKNLVFLPQEEVLVEATDLIQELWVKEECPEWAQVWELWLDASIDSAYEALERECPEPEPDEEEEWDDLDDPDEEEEEGEWDDLEDPDPDEEEEEWPPVWEGDCRICGSFLQGMPREVCGGCQRYELAEEH